MHSPTLQQATPFTIPANRWDDTAAQGKSPAELLLSRDLSYSETAALAKEQEENFLYRAMQGDIVAQVMRRLASITL